MTDKPSFYTDHRAIDLAAGDLAERLERGAGPITIVHDAGVPRYAILSIELWEVLGKMPLFKAMMAEPDAPATSLPATHLNYWPEHKRAGRIRNLADCLRSGEQERDRP